MEFIRLEPKYCELCGALWLRPAGSESSYCTNCAAIERRLTQPKSDPKAGGRAQ